MFKFRPDFKKNIPNGFFIFVSLAALIFLPTYFIILRSMILPPETNILSSGQATGAQSDYDMSDPYITKVPSLKDFIDGPIINANDPGMGDENAPITIVEYSDYQCQFCQNQEKIIKQIISEYKDQVRLIWKDYPENNINSASFQAAIAGRCADKQDKFWPYHDLLFEKGGNIDKDVLSAGAKELDLNTRDFKKCMESEEAASFVYNNIKEANALDISGVPYIYINKEEIIGEINYEELKLLIEKELENIN